MASAQKKAQSSGHATTGVAGRYGRALHTLICEKSLNSQVLPQIAAFDAALNDEFQAFLSSATVSIKAKEAVVLAVSKKVAAHPVLQNFVHLVVQKKRGAFLKEILAAVTQLEDSLNGVVHARVVSAVELSKTQESALRTFVQNKVEGAQQVVLTAEVDDALLAGMRVEVGATAYDSSLKNKLEQLKESLHQSVA